MTTPINDSNIPHTVEGLLRVVEERNAEVVFLKLMVDKLKLQLLRNLRAWVFRSIVTAHSGLS